MLILDEANYILIELKTPDLTQTLLDLKVITTDARKDLGKYQLEKVKSPVKDNKQLYVTKSQMRPPSTGVDKFFTIQASF